MQFENKARKIIEEECEDYFLGIADLSIAENPLVEQYRSLFIEYPRAISIGITLPKLAYRTQYDNILYKRTDRQLNRITSHLSNLLEQEGYNAFSFPKARKIKEKSFMSLHLIAANQADLGHIEENGLLTTPEVGSGVNWGTVLTDAPIETRIGTI